MNRRANLFLLAAALVTGAGYVLVFGDVGFLRHQMLSRELHGLEQDLFSLRKEHTLLSDQYYRLQEQEPGEETVPDRTRALTILRFEDPEAGTAGVTEPSPLLAAREGDEISLTEARILFLAIMALATLFGYYFISRLRPIAPAATASRT